jgi:hypothetical protein
VTLRDVLELDVRRVHDQVDKVLPDVRAGQLEARGAEADGERALDQTLADSFPASDPPPWTLGVARRDSKPDAIARRSQSVADSARAEVARPRALVNDVVILGGGSRGPRTPIQRLETLAGAMGVALLVPVAILVAGLPVVLLVRGIVEAITWLMTFILR